MGEKEGANERVSRFDDRSIRQRAIDNDRTLSAMRENGKGREGQEREEKKMRWKEWTNLRERSVLELNGDTKNEKGDRERASLRLVVVSNEIYEND